MIDELMSSEFEFENGSFYNNTTSTMDNSTYCKDHYEPSSGLVMYEFWVSGIGINIIGFLGILGNFLSIIILSRPQMRSSINFLLMGLAQCDIILILTSMLLFGLPAIYPATGYLFYYYYFLYPNLSPTVYVLAMAAQTSSVYLTLTITLERFVAVCHPLHVRAYCTQGRAKIYIIVIVLFSLAYNIPRYWEVTVVEHNDADLGFIFCVLASDIRRNKRYIKIYIQWMYLVFVYFVPFISLALLNTLIYKQIRKANRERQRLSRTEKREIGLATMLLCVVFVFFLCNVLALVMNILEASYEIIDDYSIKLSNLLVTINSSVNFIIYVIFGEKFKRIFLLLFCKNRIGRESPDGLMHDDSSFSNGEGTNRSSGRFQRTGTLRSSTRNGASMRITRSIRTRAPSPGPCVYYPARESISKTSTLIGGITNSKSLDWDNGHKNGNGVIKTSDC